MATAVEERTAASSISGGTSLGRLKTLDNLPSLDAQLKEIKQLCTHFARAEMILKWLSSKLQTNKDIRQSAEAWNALHSTVRILPPERIAMILSAPKVLKTLKTACQDVNFRPDLLQSGTSLLSFLLEQSSTPPGVALRAGLSLPALQAAEFVGVWLRASLSATFSEGTVNYNQLSWVLGVATDLWKLRQCSCDENEAFSAQCLIPCANLLLHTSSSTAKSSTPKRKHDLLPVDSAFAALESMLARHVFLPAREAFFKAREASSVNFQREVGAQRHSFVLESLLEPLRPTSAQLQLDSAALFESLPRLLDIALRSSPAVPPSRREHEQTWVETVFRTLFDLLILPSGELVNAQAVSGMLTVLAQRSRKISAFILNDIALKYAGLDAPANATDWELVAGVIAVDASLFKNADMAYKLFEAATKYSITLGEDAVGQTTNSDIESAHALLRERIILPVLMAFARYNDFPAALELWSEQLKKDLHDTFWSPWVHLGEAIRPLIAESLSDERLLLLILQHCRIIIACGDSCDGNDIPGLNAAIVMLDVLLGDMNAEDTLERIQPDLEKTFEALMALYNVHIGPALVPALRERRCWSLMTTIFELCFPRCVVQKRNATEVVTKICTMVPDSVLRRALDLPSTVHPNEYASVEDTKSTSDARCFAACICTHALAYNSVVDEDALRPFHEVLNTLGTVEDESSYDALLLYPTTLALMDGELRRTLLLSRAQRPIWPSQSTVSQLDIWKAIGSSAVRLAQAQVIDDLVTTALACFKHTERKEDASRISQIGLAVLSEIPARSMSRIQREKILDSICNLSRPYQATNLPLTLRLMELPNPTARICLEPAIVAEMADKLDLGTSAKGTDAAASWFGALVMLVIQQCTKTKDQERSRKMLLGLSTEVANLLEANKGALVSDTSNEDPKSMAARFALVRTVFEGLETNALDDVKAQMAHRKPAIVRKLIKKLVKAIEHILQHFAQRADRPLDLLLSIPPPLVDSSGLDIAPLLAKLATFLDNHLGDWQADIKDLDKVPAHPSMAAIMVRCYETLGTFAAAPNARLAMFADSLLQLSLEPQQHAAVLRTLEAILVRLGADNVTLAQELLGADASLPASRLLLSHLSVDKLEKADFEGSEDFLSTRILQRLLMIVSATKDFTTSRNALACIADALRSKPFVINQYNIEMTLQALHHLALRSGPGRNMLYLDICSTFSTLLLHHRSRLQGRFHILIKLLQALLTRLFEPLQGWDAATAAHPPTVKHAAALSRLLKLFCEPPQLRNKSSRAPSLVDEVRKEQAHVGTFVQHVLHAYCTQTLHGTMGKGMKDALTPGIRAMVEAMEIRGSEGGKALSAAMTGSERAVLRDVYEEWRRFGKWRGG